MKQIIRITLAVMVYLLTCSQGCEREVGSGGSAQADTAGMVRDSILGAGLNEMAGVTQTDAFGLAAAYRFHDLSDYLAILADSGRPFGFRAQAAKMVRGLFLSENCRVSLPAKNPEGNLQISVGELTAEGSHAPFRIRSWEPDSVWVESAPARKNDSLMIGVLGYSLALRAIENKGDPAKTFSGKTGFSVMKKAKVFGTDTLKVWVVLLGVE